MCDLCTEMPKPTDGGKTYTFKIRKGVKFHDGTALTAHDVSPPSSRSCFPRKAYPARARPSSSWSRAWRSPDDETVVFKLKYPSGAFIPAFANPFNFIYSKAKLDKDISGTRRT